MRIAALIACGHTCRVEFDLDLSISEVVFIQPDRATQHRKMALDRAHHHMTHAKLDIRMRSVDRPGGLGSSCLQYSRHSRLPPTSVGIFTVGRPSASGHSTRPFVMDLSNVINYTRISLCLSRGLREVIIGSWRSIKHWAHSALRTT